MLYLRQFDTTPNEVVFIIPKIGVITDNDIFMLQLRHIATHKTYTFECRLLQIDIFSFSISVIFDTIPETGQYDFLLLNDITAVVVNKTILDILPPRVKMPQYDNNITLKQYEQ